MTIQSPHLDHDLPATHEAIARIIRLLSSKTSDTYAILSESDAMTYMQTLLTPDGFVLDYQDGSLSEHYRTKRSNFSGDEIIEAFQDYADGNSTWKHRFDFERIELRPPSFHFGFFLGRMAGRIARLVRRDT